LLQERVAAEVEVMSVVTTILEVLLLVMVAETKEVLLVAVDKALQTPLEELEAVR
jgi:hypothetical protein